MMGIISKLKGGMLYYDIPMNETCETKTTTSAIRVILSCSIL